MLGVDQAVELFNTIFLPVFVAKRELEETIFLEIKDNQ